MGRLIEMHEIDEFSDVRSIPDATISEAILPNIRGLDEKNEMELSIREILYDPNETPHGPTEIADILTGHMHIRGQKRLAAFVLKGKSLQKVSSRDVTHQFAKLRQIPDLGLMVLGAVGNIQDDAQRDFVQTAVDAGCDYLIIDAQDFARLLIAYEKICPKDGTPYDETGTCKNGHVQDKGLTLEMEVREAQRTTIVTQKDVSHAGAKRYGATVLLDRHYSKDAIRDAIQEATEELKHSNYYRNDQVKARWKKTPAHVVWLFIAYDLEDIRNDNWVCRTCWIDPSLSEDMRPLGLNGNEQLEDIEILWNDDYKSHRDFLEGHSGTKEEVLGAINPILNEMVEVAKQAINNFEEYRRGNIGQQKFILGMQEMDPRVTRLCDQSVRIPIPPEDCRDYYQACQQMFVVISNMFLYYSKKGLKTWPQSKNRDRMMQDTISMFYDNCRNIEFEERKIH